MRTKKLSKKQLKQAIIGSSGLISTIAQKLNVSRTTVRNYVDNDSELQELLLDETENVLDFAESKLIKKVNDEDLGAIKYLLSSKGKKRGFGSKDLLFGAQNNQGIPTWFGEGDKNKNELSEEMKNFVKGIEYLK